MLVILFGIYRYFFAQSDDARYYIMEDAFEDKTEAYITGMVHNYEDKEKNCAVYLKDVYVQIGTNNYYELSDLLVYIPKSLLQSEKSEAYKISYIKIGTYLEINGTIYKPETPSNPGQFNQKAYLREKNIYYTAVAKSAIVSYNQNSDSIFNNLYNSYLEKLQALKEKLIEVYSQTLPEKECGIVTAMLLGEKTLLDMDIKKLYQESGISHLLAISGLHISIICMAVYKLTMALAVFICSVIKQIYMLINNSRGKGITLRYVKITNCMCSIIRIISASVSIAFTIMYGRMTGFSISTSRAVIMAVIMLLAPLIRRSYDMLSTMGVSAVIILWQKPFAVYSCSFLLSFGAVSGIAIVYPVLKKCI